MRSGPCPLGAPCAKEDFGGSVMVGNHLRHEDFRPVIKLYAIPLAKPQDDLVAHVTPDQGSSVWSTPHCALTAFTARHRRGERRGSFAATRVAIGADPWFAAPVSPAITSLESSPEALARCGVNRALSDR
jgi:hypothetical protein